VSGSAPRSSRDDSQPPGNELALVLWVLVVLVATVELAWWLTMHLYSA
jgi:hypothetical protein